jgi:hypothetical protein
MADGSAPLAGLQKSAAVRCRQIAFADIDHVAALLVEGFPERDMAYWLRGLNVMAQRTLPEGAPRFGYMLEAGGEAVGVLLTIFSEDAREAEPVVRCNSSSWYVRKPYRFMSMQLVSRIHSHRGVTFINISPAAHTLPINEVMGYLRYVEGQTLCAPALGPIRRAKVQVFDAGLHAGRLSPREAALMADHAQLGFLALVCEEKGDLVPFVFLGRAIRHLPLATAQLAWCRSTDDFVRLSGPIGRWMLWRRAIPLVLIDAVGPVAGLVGRFFKDRSPKYFRGPHRPRPNDLAYTEAAIFGF